MPRQAGYIPGHLFFNNLALPLITVTWSSGLVLAISDDQLVKANGHKKVSKP